MITKQPLSITHPELAKQAVGWDPSSVTYGSDKRLPWKCSDGHIWETSIANRTIQKSGCPYCAGQRVLAGVNDLASQFPELALEVDGWNASEVAYGTAQKKPWVCGLGHKWTATVLSRKQGNGCPYCANQKVLAGFNDLKSANPALALEANGWDPSKVLAKSHKKVSWKCKEGHVWVAQIANRSNGNNCPRCMASGFDSSVDGWLYFLRHPGWHMLQIGITNFPNNRIRRHARTGWELVELRGPMDGLIAREWETSILHMLKRSGAKLADESIAGKFDGFTEAWEESTYEATSLRELMDAVERGEPT